MKLRPTKQHIDRVVNKQVARVMSTEGEYLTEEQLAEVMGLSVKLAVIKALKLNFSRIKVKNSRYYSKRQVQKYLDTGRA